MKRRILATVLALAMVLSLFSVIAAATPYVPTGIAYKDFGQENIYLYEVKAGEAAPRQDGVVTESDGYGEPIATYGLRYVTTAEYVVYQADMSPRPEYVLNEEGEGEYFVYPTPDTPDSVWDSIKSLKTDSDYAYVYTSYVPTTSWSATTSYMYYNPYTKGMSTCYGLTKEDFENKHFVAKASNTLIPTLENETLLTEEPDDWYTNYKNYFFNVQYTSAKPYNVTPNFERVTGDKAPEFVAGKYYKGDYVNRYQVALYNIQTLNEEPANWATTYKNYYRKNSASGYLPVTSASAPEFHAGVFYSGDTLVVEKFYVATSGGVSMAGTVGEYAKARVILPEHVNLYARYDNRYVYIAIEVDEYAHTDKNYDLTTYYDAYAWNNLGLLNMNRTFGATYRKLVGSNTATIIKVAPQLRINGNSELSTAGYQAGVLNKYGNNVADIETANQNWFNITHRTKAQLDAEEPKKTNSQDDEFNDFDEFDEFGELGGGAEEETSIDSGTYGRTVYEYKQLWTVLNSRYDGSGSAVPARFTMFASIQLQNNLCNGAFVFHLGLPRDTRYLPGGIARGGGNYSDTLSLLRMADPNGMPLGKFRFNWVTTGNTYRVFSFSDLFTTDAYTVESKKSDLIDRILPVCITAGPEPDAAYATPEIDGVQCRVNDSEKQGLRAMVKVPRTNKEIEEVGLIVAPAEAARRGHLTLGMDSIAYYCEDYADYYGIADGKWQNLLEDSSNVANSLNLITSFATYDLNGGLPSGIYKVNTIKADLEDPYTTKSSYKIYDIGFTGLYDDFDDYFTFYAMRPYVKYADGTVVYGEYEYKSVYYVACWTIAKILEEYNAANSYSTVESRYNMDQMRMNDVTVNGAALKDKDGNPVFQMASSTAKSISPHYGSANFSIYNVGARKEVFRWYAIRMVNKANPGLTLRVKNYDSFNKTEKQLIGLYENMLEYLWQSIENCEKKVYFSAN